MFYYEGTVTRVRLINKFPSHALTQLHPEAEWAAQLLIVSRWFATPEGDWNRCCDLDATEEDPNIFIEVVVGGAGPITLKSANSKDLIAGTLFLDKDLTIDYNVENPEPLEVVYSCSDIYTKAVKGKSYLRRHLHIEKGGRLLWNLQRGRFVELIPTASTPVGEALIMCPVEDKQFVSANTL